MRAIKLLGSVAVLLACLLGSAVCSAQSVPLYAVPFVSEVTPPSLSVSATAPGNGNFTLTILGANFTPSAVVSLTAFGSYTIHPTTTTVNASGSQITAQFTNAFVPPATLVLTVTNPTGASPTSNPYYLPNTPAEPSVVLSQNSTSYLTGSPKGIVAAYLGGGQNLDFAVVSLISNTVSIQSSNLNGPFTAGPSYVTGNQPWGITTADFFGTGQLGLAITNSLDNTVTILLPNGGGTFRPGNLITLPGVFPTQIVAADFNGDGKMDLAVLNTCGAGPGACFPQTAPQGPGTVTILLGDGFGGFTVSPTVITTGSAPNTPYAMVAADFNGDGIIDLAVANSGSNNVTLFMGNGDGTFTPAINSVATGNSPSGIAVGDFNGDGQLDLAITNSADNTVSILLNQNCSAGPAVACTFVPAATALAVGGAPSAIATGDLNADGNLDLVVTNASGSSVSILLGDGTGNFTAVVPQGAQNFATGYSPQAVVLGDFNQDGRLDILTSNASGTYTYLQQAAVPQVTLGSNNLSTFYGYMVTFTANVSPTSSLPAPTGTVTFFDGSIPLTTVSLSNSQAVWWFDGLNAGTHQVTAVYSGDFNFVPATSNAVTETVAKSPTSTTLSANVTTVPYGQPFTLTATIQVPGINPATGTIKFFDTTTSTDLGDISPVNNQAQVTLSNLAGGTHVIVATYSGDNNFNGSSSANLTETISPAPTATTVSASPSPAVFGQTVTFSATVQPGTGNTATGAVLFFDNMVQVGSGTLTNNAAQYSTNALSVGTHAITAQYTGDANFASSTSQGSPATINPATTTTTITSNLNPSAYGQGISYNATVKASFGTLPAGTISYFDGTTLLGAFNTAAGPTQLTISSLTAGTHSITAQYSTTNTNFAASTSAALTQTVNQTATTLTLASSANPSSFGQSVTLLGILQNSYNVISNGGTISFYDNGTLLGSGTVQGTNPVSVTTTAIGVGARNITAKYSGDANLLPSTGSMTQNNNPAPTTITMTYSPNSPVFGQSITITANVKPTYSNTPTGTVTFTIGSQTLGTGTVNNNAASISLSTLAPGTQIIEATYSGDADSASSANYMYLTVLPPATTTVLSSTVNPSSMNQANTLTATISSTASGAPTGTVNFYDGGALIGGTTVSNGTGQVSVSGFLVGTHTITATYSGDSNFSASTAAAYNQVVNLGPTVTSVISLDNPGTVGYVVRFIVTGTATYGGAPAGVVTLYDGSTVIGSGGLPGNANNNSVQLNVSGLTVGSHSISVKYAGSVFYAASTSAVVTQVMNLPATNTSLNAAPSPASYGQPVTLNATVQPPGSATATGTVTFYNGAASLGTSPVTGNSAQLSVSSLPVGANSLTAKYSGDANFAGSTSTSFNETINQTASATTVSSSANPATVGQPVTFTASVTPAFGTSPTGTITFYDGSASIGNVAVSSGAAQITSSSLSIGAHSITAKYSGDGNFSASTSSALAQTVNLAATTTTIASSLNASTYGQSVSLTATVQPPSGTSATGTITFMDGSTTLGTATLSTNSAQLTLTSLAGGSHTITAVYGGNASLAGSTSAALSQGVNPASTTTTATSSANPSTAGQSLTFIVSVQPAFGGTAGGTVSFFDGTTNLGTASLANNSGQFSISTLTPGSHSIAAKYNADSNTLGSTSAVLTQTINQASTTTALAADVNPATFEQTITFTVTVTPAAGGMPTGMVTLMDGTVNRAIGYLTGTGTVQFSITGMFAGAHSLTAVYAGDADFTGSASAALTESINPASTATVVSSSLNPITYGQAVTFTATVQPPAGTSASGSVTFMDGSASLGSATLSSNSAQLTLSSLAAGAHSVTAVYGGSTNLSGSTSSALVETVNAAASSIALTSSSATATVGQAITLTATVQPSAGSTASGTVTFYDGTTAIGTATLASNSAQLSVSTLTLGTHSITATYGGNGNLAASSSAALVEAITQASTTVSFTSSLNPAAFGQAVQFSGTVQTPSGGAATGTVTFFDGTTSLGTATVTNNGVQHNSVTLYYSGFAGGTHTITASYSGDANYAASTSAPLTETITQASSTVSIASGLNPGNFGQSVTVTATVLPSISGDFAGGTVTFYDGATALGTVSLSSEVVQLSLSNLAAGSHSITAKYSGDGNFAGSTSPVLAETINQGSTTVTVASSANPSTFGQAITLSATIQPGFGNATGTITFLDGSVSLGTSGMSGNAAQLSISSLGVGAHSITAKYSGDANFSASTSSAFSQTINQASTTANVTSSVNPAAFGQSVIFTVKVQSSSSSAPTGTVSLRDGATSLGSSALAPSGTAQFTVNGFSLGSHSITATYSGDASFSGSTSAALAQVVNQASTTTSLSSSANPSSYGQPVTFTASVAPLFGGAPTGTVTFLDGGAQIGTATVSANVATLTMAATALSAGSHSITASYSGDANFAGSSSAAFSQVVNGAATTTTLVSSLNPSVHGQSVKFTATVSSTVSGTQSGTVSFYLDGSTTPAQSSALTGGTVTFSTDSLSGGSHTVTAAFVSTNANFQGSSSALLTQNVMDFSISASPASLTISRSQSGTTTLTVAPIAGFSGNVSLSCSGQPASTNCNVSPNQVTLNGTNSAQATVTIKTDNHAPVGTYSLTLKGTSGSVTHTAALSLTIN